MPRKGPAPKRPLVVDPVYGSPLVTQLVNKILLDGKKSIAERTVYGALDLMEKRTRQDPLKTFHEALENVRPVLEVRSRRVGGATYQVPVEVAQERGITLAMRWILDTSRGRGGRNFSEKLAAELMDAANGQGASVKKKDDTHRMAEANRAFAHFR